jgi:hypothetical protein
MDTYTGVKDALVRYLGGNHIDIINGKGDHFYMISHRIFPKTPDEIGASRDLIERITGFSLPLAPEANPVELSDSGSPNLPTCTSSENEDLLPRESYIARNPDGNRKPTDGAVRQSVKKFYTGSNRTDIVEAFTDAFPTCSHPFLVKMISSAVSFEDLHRKRVGEETDFLDALEINDPVLRFMEEKPLLDALLPGQTITQTLKTFIESRDALNTHLGRVIGHQVPLLPNRYVQHVNTLNPHISHLKKSNFLIQYRRDTNRLIEICARASLAIQESHASSIKDIEQLPQIVILRSGYRDLVDFTKTQFRLHTQDADVSEIVDDLGGGVRHEIAGVCAAALRTVMPYGLEPKESKLYGNFVRQTLRLNKSDELPSSTRRIIKGYAQR